ncbi:MAG: tail fiber domain-containing protein [Bacteroidota bacterium]
MKNLVLLACIVCLALGGDLCAQTINMGTSPINFGNGCGYGQIQDLNGTRKLSIGGFNGCVGPVGGWSTITVDYWLNRVGIGYGLTSPSFLLQLSQNSAAKPGSAYWTVVSDARFKKDIRPYTRGLDLINGIDPVYFTYNEASGVNDESEFVGVLAQDLQTVAPDMVSYIPHPTEKDATTDYLSVDLSQLDFALVNAVKELDKELQKLRSEVAALRADLQQAQGQNEALMNGTSGTLFVAPNPFQSETKVMYSLQEEVQQATLEIYSLDGKLLQTQVLDSVQQGETFISMNRSATSTLIFRLVADGKTLDSQQVMYGN